MVRNATMSDDSLQQLTHIIQEGFPDDCRALNPNLRPYYKYRDSLCCVDGVVLLGERIVIPARLRLHILHALHSAHQGVSAMCARAADSVFWPNMTIDITKTREQCHECNRIAKSQPMQPPSTIEPPDYPFQQVCCDYFTYANHDYIVLVDRYSNWPMVFRSESGAQGLVKHLREAFVTFGIPEVLTSDGGPQFKAHLTKAFLESWGTKHRITSVANPHANSRAEIGVKTVKRILMDNISPTGSLETERFQKAMLAYRNTIDPQTKASPAMILFGRPIRDAIPIPLGKYCPHPTWRELMVHREKALAKRHCREHEKWSEHTRQLPPLQVGDAVYIQNLTGNHPKRWERTGRVVEVRQFHQYVVRVDGSGRVTLRNRQHLRKYVPFRPPVSGGQRVEDAQLPPAAPIPARNNPSATLPEYTNDTSQAPQLGPVSNQTPTAGTPQPTIMPSVEPAPYPLAASVPTDVEMPAVPPLTVDSTILPVVPPVAGKVPRMMARLRPHNAPGTAESPSLGTRRRVTTKRRSAVGP